MTSAPQRFGTALLFAISVLLLVGVWVVAPGFVLVDEFVYFLGAEGLLHGRLTISNGIETFGSPDLKFFNLVNGPDGLVPQYPVGSAILGAPMLALFGLPGMVLINALSAVAIIFLTRALGRAIFGDETVALVAALLMGVASFLPDYAFAIWPHASSSAFVLLAVYLGWRAVDADAPADLRLMAGAGFALGCAFLLRVEALLAIPPIAVLALLYSRRWHLQACVALAGLAPALLLATFANAKKFGVWNPISYGGRKGQGVDLGSHIEAIAALLAVIVLIFLIRRVEWRPQWRFPVLAVGTLAVTALWYFVPQFRSVAGHYAYGFFHLLFDMRWTVDTRAGIVDNGDGTVHFWGRPKKALGQSLPWICLALWLFLRPWGQHRKALIFLGLLCVVWTLPFMMLSWHGGPGGNMRYFLSIVPALALLSAAALVELWRLAPLGGRGAILSVVAGLAIVFGWSAAGPAGFNGAHQIATYWFFLMSVSVAAVVALMGYKQQLLKALQAVAFAGFGAAFALGPVSDVAHSQAFRTWSATSNASGNLVAERSLVVGPPGFFAYQIPRPEGYLAFPAEFAPLDIELIRRMHDEGYAIYLWKGVLEEAQRRMPDLVEDASPLFEDTVYTLHKMRLED